MGWAKTNDVPMVLTGHVTKGGDIAGPRVLEHHGRRGPVHGGRPDQLMAAAAGGEEPVRVDQRGRACWRCRRPG